MNGKNLELHTELAAVSPVVRQAGAGGGLRVCGQTGALVQAVSGSAAGRAGVIWPKQDLDKEQILYKIL